MRRQLTDAQLIAQGLNPLYITLPFLLAHDLNETFPERFLRHVRKTDFHWFWEGTTRPPLGHGQMKCHGGYDNIKIYAHVASWLLHKGPIPEGKQINHRCPGGHVPACVNPDHLYCGDQFENMQDMTAAGHNYFSTHAFRGENHANSTLTWEDVQQMRLLHSTGNYVLRQLAEMFHCSIGNCSHIVRNEAWVVKPDAPPPIS